jgi:DNA-binding transcriptional MerR regulator
VATGAVGKRAAPARRSGRSAAKAPPDRGEPSKGITGLPDKPFFKIGEAARLAGVKPFVLRYWETEFRSLRPEKTRSNQRLYRRKDVELVLRIRQLLHEERFTIEGARQRLRELGHDEAAKVSVAPPQIDEKAMQKIKQGLLDLIRLVED